jgi:hypothetical protein
MDRTVLEQNKSLCTVTGVWTSWFSWTLCNRICNTGEQVRRRSCIFKGDENSINGNKNLKLDFLNSPYVHCDGDNSEKRSCNHDKCELFTSERTKKLAIILCYCIILTLIIYNINLILERKLE